MKKIDLGKITSKFYRDEDIWLKGHQTQPEVNELQAQIGDLMLELYVKGYKFNVFHLDVKNGIMYAALLYCCGQWRDYTVDPRLRKELIDPIIHTKTRYKKIVWEDLVQTGEAY